MTSTKTLYSMTLVLAGLAGFSTGWTVRPAEVRVVVSFEERLLMDYEAAYRIPAAERERLRGILQEFSADMETLRTEFDRDYGAQVDALKDRYDARIREICTPDRRR